MNQIEQVVRRIDRFQQRHTVPAVIWAVVQKFGNDQAGALAARFAYHGLFSLFPLLLLLTTILGYLLQGNPTMRHDILNTALANFPVVGPQLRSTTHSLAGSAPAIAVGIAGLLYGAMGISQSALASMNAIWNIPYVKWPNFFLRHARGFLLIGLFGLVLITSGSITAWAPALLGAFTGPLVSAASVLLDFGVFTASFIVLTAEPLRFRDVALGAALATVFWQVLLGIGGWVVSRQLAHASATYGALAFVIALLSWMYLVAELTLLAAEINVVIKYHLWPRSITQPPLTSGDRAVFERLAVMEARRPEYLVSVEFLPVADQDPLAAAGDDGATGTEELTGTAEPSDREDGRGDEHGGRPPG